MDEINRKILTLLARDARLPVKTIAAEVGLSRSAVRDRISRLESNGTIRGYRAEIAPPDGAQNGLRAFLILKARRTPCRDAVARMVAMPDVLRCYSISGDIDLIVECLTTTPGALNALRDEIASLPDIADVTTAIVLHPDKD